MVLKSQSTEKSWNHTFYSTRLKTLYLRNALMCFNPTRGFQRINGYCSFRYLHWSHGTLARRGQADSWRKQQYHLQYLLMMRIAPTAKMCTVRRGEKPYCVQFNLWYLGGKMYLLEVCLHWNHEGWEQEVSARRETPYGKQTLPFHPPGSRSLQGSCQSRHSTGTSDVLAATAIWWAIKPERLNIHHQHPSSGSHAGK